MRPSFFVHHMEKEAGQVSVPGVLSPSHLPSPITLIILHEAVSQADYLKKSLSQGLSSEAAKLSSPPNHLCLRYLRCKHIAFRRLFLIKRLYSAQFNRTLILAGAFLKRLYFHTSNSNNIQLQKSPAQMSNTDSALGGQQTVKSRKWLSRHDCNWTELICSFRLQTTNSHFSQPQKK